MAWLREVAAHLHVDLADHLLPKDTMEAATTRSDVNKFANLFALVTIIVPVFAVYYVAIGMMNMAAALALAGVGMVGSIYLYRRTGNAQLARDSFLGSLLCFIIYGSWQLGGLVSPSGFWLAVIPVVAVLLGGRISGWCWLCCVLAAIAGLFFSSDPAAVRPSELWPEHLYALSLCGMIVSVFLFVLMVDAARKATFERLEEANREIQELAQRDSLTGLFNRRFVWEALQKEEHRSRATNSGFFLLLIDIDRFKRINDAFGHLAGDIVLKGVADAIDRAVGDRGFCGRYGGEEFLVLLPERSVKPDVVASDIRNGIAHLGFAHVGGPKQVTASIGWAEFRSTETFGDTFKRADMALYTAKQTGRDRSIAAA